MQGMMASIPKMGCSTWTQEKFGQLFFSVTQPSFCHIKQVFGDFTEQLTEPKSSVMCLQCWHNRMGNPVTSKLKHCRQWDQHAAASFNKLCCYSHALPQWDVRIPTASYELFNTDYCLTTCSGYIMGLYKVSSKTSRLWARLAPVLHILGQDVVSANGLRTARTGMHLDQKPLMLQLLTSQTLPLVTHSWKAILLLELQSIPQFICWQICIFATHVWHAEQRITLKCFAQLKSTWCPSQQNGLKFYGTFGKD